MKFKDPQEMMERAQLRVLISEMREKVAKMEAELRAAHAQIPGYGVKLQLSTDNNKKKNNDVQEIMKQQLTTLDQEIKDLHSRIDAFQSPVDQMVRKVSVKSDIEKELDMANATIKELEEERNENASLTKAQLISLGQQLSDLEKSRIVKLQREKEYEKVLQALGDLEAEATRLRQGNGEVLLHNKALREKIVAATKRTKDIASLTMEDVMPEIIELRSRNRDLNKMVESLQDPRFNEAEELVYLKWVNTCLYHDLNTYKASYVDSKSMLDNRTKLGLSRKTYTKKTNLNNMPNFNNNVSPSRKSDSYRGNNSSLFVSAGVYSTLHASQRNAEILTRSHDLASSGRDSYGEASYTKVISEDGVNNEEMDKFHYRKIVSRPDIQNLSDAGSQSSRYHGSSPSMWNISHFNGRDSYGEASYTKVISEDGVNNEEMDKLHYRKIVSRPDIQNLSDAGSQSSRYHGSATSMWNISHFNERTNMVTSPSTSQRDSMEGFVTHSEKSHSRSSRKHSIRRFFSMGSDLEAPDNQMKERIQKDEGRTLRISSETFQITKIIRDISNRKEKARGRNPRLYGMPSMKHSEIPGISVLEKPPENINSAYKSTSNTYSSSSSPWENGSFDLEISPLSIVIHEAHSSKDHDTSSIREHDDGSYKSSSAFKIFSKLTQVDTSVPDFEDFPKKKHDHGEEKMVKNTLLLEWYESSSKENTDDSLVPTGMENALTQQHSQLNTSSTSNAFVRDLARSVQLTLYKYIEDVVAFISWLDKQPDKEDFFNCKDWPTKRVDAMRWSSNEFENLKALESEINFCFKYDPSISPEVIHEHMLNVHTKAKKYIHDFTEARDWIILQLKNLDLPTDWMLDSGIIAKTASDRLNEAIKSTRFMTTPSVKEGFDQLSEVGLKNGWQLQ